MHIYAFISTQEKRKKERRKEKIIVENLSRCPIRL